MKIGKVRALCEPRFDQERNYEMCKRLDGVAEEIIWDVDRHILNYDREKNPLQNIDKMMGMQSDGVKVVIGSSSYNTWPFVSTADTIFPRFLAVCRGRQRLGGVFEKVLEQSEEIAEKYRNYDYVSKTVLVLTDKWDVVNFKKYEKELLQYAINDGIWYIFLLVTEYGYTQIPFLPNDRNALEKLQGENIER